MSKTANNPSTEGKTQVKTASADVSMTTNTAAATDMTKATATEQNLSTADSLSADYLKAGYLQGEGKGRYTDPDLIDHAKVFGKTLAKNGTPSSAIKRNRGPGYSDSRF